MSAAGRVTELDRKLAATEIEHIRSTGECDVAEAARRLALVQTATTHAALRVAVDGRAGDAIPPALEAAPRIATALWLLVSAVHVVIWLVTGVTGGDWDPWPLWVLFGGGVLVAGVWAAREWDRRLRSVARAG
ncbi:hypothetical protein [Amycolatopsis sp. MtRt-6]|uniref:hypothetical protein n=1 Tax=Amycolatopsis sp. MtRt-6 TaxID=2792782 RepID=UPI001A8EF1C2|nr:hypothetical protein [Amycolatopsis sp. MtRt-6]